MSQVTIVVNGHGFRLSCEDGEEERIAQLADFINQKIMTIKQANGAIGSDRMFVMALLMIADQYWDAKQDLMDLKIKLDHAQSPQTAQDLHTAVDRVEALKHRLLSLDEEDDEDLEPWDSRLLRS